MVAVVDIEVLPNWTYGMAVEQDGTIVWEYERWDGDIPTETGELPASMITYNGMGYDLYILAAIRKGWTAAQVHELSSDIIQSNRQAEVVCRDSGISRYHPPAHMDVLLTKDGAVSPGGLKMRAAKHHVPLLMTMPTDPHKPVTDDEAEQNKVYCHSDCMATWHVVEAERPQIRNQAELPHPRPLETSPASIAEGIWRKHATQWRPSRLDKGPPVVVPSPYERDHAALTRIRRQIDGTRSRYALGPCELQFSRGGLHSVDKPMVLHDVAFVDATSFYPQILGILCGDGPECLTHNNIRNFGRIMTNFIATKEEKKRLGQAATAEKLAMNTATGKLGSEYSCLGNPRIHLSMMLSGQFFMTSLIYWLTYHGIEVYSANTDGIVCQTLPGYRDLCDQWGRDHGFGLTYDEAMTLCARDVNSYVVRQPDGKIKRRGCFNEPGVGLTAGGVRKAPLGEIIYEAAAMALIEQTEWRHAYDYIYNTVMDCMQITMFLIVKQSAGGMFLRGKPVGAVNRWVVKAGGPPLKTTRGSIVPLGEHVQLVPDIRKADLAAVDRLWYVDQAMSLWELIRAKGPLL